MEDNEVESKYPPRICGSNHHHDEDQYEDNNTVEEDAELADQEDENDSDDGFNNTHEDDNLHEEDDNDKGHEGDIDTDTDDEDAKPIVNRRSDNVETRRQPKKPRLENLITNYEFLKQSFGSRNSPTEWTEHETLVLLDAWGDRFLQRERKSLRSEDWQEVAEKVSEVSKTARTDSQCRNRLHTLKKKYKKEKKRLKQANTTSSKWVYFKKMDMLMSGSPQLVQGSLSCGLDAGQYVFMNTRAYLKRANGLGELRDSPGDSNSAGENDSDEHSPEPAKVAKIKPRSSTSSSYDMLADSILNFSRTYDKVENSRRQQIIELEKMRTNFLEELEIQKKAITEKAKQNIAKILRLGDEESSDRFAVGEGKR